MSVQPSTASDRVREDSDALDRALSPPLTVAAGRARPGAVALAADAVGAVDAEVGVAGNLAVVAEDKVASAGAVAGSVQQLAVNHLVGNAAGHLCNKTKKKEISERCLFPCTILHGPTQAQSSVTSQKPAEQVVVRLPCRPSWRMLPYLQLTTHVAPKGKWGQGGETMAVAE